MSIHSLPAGLATYPPIALTHLNDGVGKIRLISLATALPLAERDALEPLSRRVALDQKETLYGQDEPAVSVFNVTSGALRLYRLLPDGRRMVTGFAFPGDFLGLSLLDRFAV
ncbi:cyclic nucleotide-binding domain-containing protein, partial [Methylobacterium sp. BTF04]|uniref:Crp/Fnr family transcriptional regulator n=1 Tax=Methylobacterium sp. BTF04 TaxID=2708300 RepID=UPI0013D27E42